MNYLWFAIPMGIFGYALIFGIVAVLYSGVTSTDQPIKDEDMTAASLWPITLPFFLGAKIFIAIQKIPLWINQKRLDRKELIKW